MARLVTVATFDLPHNMAIPKGKLESEGIECWVKDELTAQVYHFYSQAIGGVKWQVKEEDFEEARRILIETGTIRPSSEPLANHPKIIQQVSQWMSYADNRKKLLTYFILLLLLFTAIAILFDAIQNSQPI